MDHSKSYTQILKSTFLFGFVQVFNILSKVILNKVVVVLLGASGVGLIGIFNNIVNIVKTGAGLGVAQSAVKDISHGHAEDNRASLAEITHVVRKLTLYLACAGAVITALLSPAISYFVFHSYKYSGTISLLSVAVFFGIFNDTQQTILKGIRSLRKLAIANLIATASTVCISIPIYYYLKIDGIGISIVVSSATMALVFFIYKTGIPSSQLKFSLKELLNVGKPMIMMGISLMIVSFMVLLNDLVIASYINKYGGIKTYGYFQAGVILVTSYFGIILTAISTDYYPRISAVSGNDFKITNELNQQTGVSLNLAFPLVVVFLVFSDYIISILYSKQFLPITQYTNLAVLGMLILICSNNMGIILLAKQNSKIFLVSSISQRLFGIAASIFLFKTYGLYGLGMSYLIMAVIHFIVMSAVLHYFYSIHLNKNITVKLIVIIFAASMLHYLNLIHTLHLRLLIGGAISAVSVMIAYRDIRQKIKSI